MTATKNESFTRHGETLTPGVNVDRVDIAAGLSMAERIGYGDANSQMVTEYALARWARGEEEGAVKSFLSGGVDLTSAYMIISAAASAGGS